MKAWGFFGLVFAGVLAVSQFGISQAAEPDSEETRQAKSLAAAAAARAKDKAWKPSSKEVGLIQIGDEKNPGSLLNYCLNKEGNILAGFVPKDSKGAIREYSPEG